MLTKYNTQILKQRRTDVQVLRGVAVLLVIIFHLNERWMPLGFLGVDLFFHISGFVVTLSICNSLSPEGALKFRISEFLLRRFKRLFLPLSVTCIFTLLISFLFLSPEVLELTSYSALFSLAGVSNIFFLFESGYFSAPADSFLLLHTWSLSIEEQFYIVISLIFGINYFKISRAIIIGLTAASLSLYLLHVFSAESQFNDEQVFYLIFFRFWQLGLGCIAAFTVIEIDKKNLRLPKWLYFLSLIFMTLVIILAATHLISVHLTTLLLGISSFCLFSTGHSHDIEKALLFKGLSLAGDRSYSLYLVHWPVVGLFIYLGGGVNKNYVLCVIVIIFAAELLYRCIEKGALVARQTYWPMFSLYSMMLVTMISAFSLSSDGMKWRVKKITTEKLDLASPPETNTWKKRFTSVPDNTEIRTYRPGDKKFNARVLVLGDSHARALRFLGREIVSKQPIQWTVMAYPGCPPILGYHKHYDSEAKRGLPKERDCQNLIAQWEREIIQRGEKFDYIILAARWNYMFNDAPFRGKAFRKDRLAQSNSRETITQAQSRANFDKGLNYTVDLIRQSGSTPIFATQAPLATMPLRRCDAIPFHKYLSKFTSCNAYSYPDIMARGAFVDQVVRNMYANRKIGLLPLVELLCDSEREVCDTHQEGFRIGDDDNHLNAWGGKILADRWRESEYWPFNDLEN